jgi:hypothetical protein
VIDGCSAEGELGNFENRSSRHLDTGRWRRRADDRHERPHLGLVSARGCLNNQNTLKEAGFVGRNASDVEERAR